jgi:hypothetical protein
MSQYLWSTYTVEGEVPGAPMTPEEMQRFMERVVALEAEMDASGTFASVAPSMAPTQRPSSA